MLKVSKGGANLMNTIKVPSTPKAPDDQAPFTPYSYDSFLNGALAD